MEKATGDVAFALKFFASFLLVFCTLLPASALEPDKEVMYRFSMPLDFCASHATVVKRLDPPGPAYDTVYVEWHDKFRRDITAQNLSRDYQTLILRTHPFSMQAKIPLTNIPGAFFRSDAEFYRMISMLVDLEPLETRHMSEDMNVPYINTASVDGLEFGNTIEFSCAPGEEVIVADFPHEENHLSGYIGAQLILRWQDLH